MAAAVLPLDQRTVPMRNKNGVQKEAPAVHKLWAEPRLWAAYQPPDGDMLVPGAAQSWLAMADRVEADLAWLLRLKANR